LISIPAKVTKIATWRKRRLKTMTAAEAKNQFGEFLDAIQQEPVVVTDNDRPVGIMLSIDAAANSLIPELFMEQEAGYEEWLRLKVGSTLDRVKKGTARLRTHEDAIGSLQSRVETKLASRLG
jgi:prevent-host-death family protein